MISDKKEIQNTLKYYFSSLSARKCSFLYTGVTKSLNEFILCNLEPDKLVKFCDATLSFHIVTIKNSTTTNHNKIIKQFFQFIGLSNSEPYVTKVTAIISQLNKVKFDFDQIELKKDNAGIIYHQTDEEKIAIAWPITIFQCIQMLNKFYEKYNILSPTSTTLEKIQPISADLTLDDVKAGNIILKTLDTSQYKTIEGTNLLEDKLIQKFDIALIDGVDTVSSKEVFKKADTSCVRKLLTWVKDGYIEYVSTYETPTHNVVSVRPHVRYYIKQNMQKRKKK